jgi:hypothetical protein
MADAASRPSTSDVGAPALLHVFLEFLHTVLQDDSAGEGSLIGGHSATY